MVAYGRFVKFKQANPMTCLTVVANSELGALRANPMTCLTAVVNSELRALVSDHTQALVVALRGRFDCISNRPTL